MAKVRFGTAGMAAGVVLLGALAVSQPAAWAEPPAGEPCTRHSLPLPTGGTTSLDGSDPTGRYQIGSIHYSEGSDHLVRWKDHVLQDAGSLDGVRGEDVNQSGEMVGTALKDDQLRSWRWRDGDLVWLPAARPDRKVRAVAINAAGTVAGTAENRSDGWDHRVVVWSAADAVRELAIPEGFNEAYATDIDDDGTVVGVVQDWDYEGAGVNSAKAVAWFPDGDWRFLPALGTDPFADVVGVRDGTVLGTSTGSTNDHVAVVWRAASGGPTEVAPDLNAAVVALSGSGSIATSAHSEIALLQDGVRRPLPLPPTTDAMSGGYVADVTDDDVVYGHFSSEQDGVLPFWWDCRPAR
jgi:uncharacterized membrane protein